jgi:hypothetical protein
MLAALTCEIKPRSIWLTALSSASGPDAAVHHAIFITQIGANQGPHPHGKTATVWSSETGFRTARRRHGPCVCRCALVHHAMGMTTTTTTRPQICTAPRIYIRPLKTVRLTTTAMVPRPKAHDDATLWDGSSDRCSSIQKNMACRPAQPPEVRCAFVAFPFPWQPPPRRISRPSVTYAGRGK